MSLPAAQDKPDMLPAARSPDAGTGPAAPAQPAQGALVPRAAYAAGELVFSEGSAGKHAFLLLEGKVEICKRVGERLMAVHTVQADELFGEMAPLTGEPRTASAVARTEVLLEKLDHDALMQRLRDRPVLASRLVERLAHMLPRLQDQLVERFGTTPATPAVAQQQGRPWNAWLQRWLGAQEPAFDPAALALRDAEPPRLVRRVSGAMLALLAVLLVWSCIGMLDVAVPGQGRIASGQPPTVVQSFEQALLKEVRVSEGQPVKQGEVLVLLDPTDVEADTRQLERQRIATQARLARLSAELGDGPVRAAFSADAQTQDLEATLYASRRQQHDSTVRAHEEEIASLAQQIQTRRGELAEQERQRRHVADLLALRERQYREEREAYQREGVYKVQYLEASRQLAAVERETLALKESSTTLDRQRASKAALLQSFRGEWRARILEELATQRRELVRVTEQAAKQGRSSGLVALRAPLDGVVQRLAFRNPGAVIRSAETVLELVPTGGELQVEIDLSPADIARVRVGDKVRVRLDALTSAQQVLLPGTLDFVSPDAYAQRLDGQHAPAYRSRVRLQPGYETWLPKGFRLQPGMTASASIHIGERRIISYLFYPIQRAMGESLREP